MPRMNGSITPNKKITGIQHSSPLIHWSYIDNLVSMSGRSYITFDISFREQIISIQVSGEMTT
jgi:hypothetical protein